MKTQSSNGFIVHSVAVSYFGKGCLARLAEGIHRNKTRRALIVTDQFLYDNGTVEQVAKQIDQGGAEFAVYRGVQPNPTVEIVEECRRLAHQIDADLLVAVGGGSAVDTAKAVGILCTNGGAVADYEGVNKSRVPSLPIVAVNTTAGTGSEVTSFYIITDPARKSKMCMTDPNCMVSIAINDSSLMMSMPPALTAATGMDALTHAVEAVLSRSANSLTDKDALWAIRTIVEYLPRAFRNGEDVEARDQMSYAQNVAGMAFSNSGLGMVHAMAHSLGGFYNLPHGICNAILLPYVMEFNGKDSSVLPRYQAIAAAAGVRGAQWLSPARSLQESIRVVRSLSDRLGIPGRLSQLDPVNPADFSSLAHLAMQDACMEQNPVMPTQAQVEAVYQYVFYGRQ